MAKADPKVDPRKDIQPPTNTEDWEASVGAIEDRLGAVEKEIMAVPHKRCETCLSWVRLNQFAAVGSCTNRKNMGAHQPVMPDLSCCTLWKDARA